MYAELAVLGIHITKKENAERAEALAEREGDGAASVGGGDTLDNASVSGGGWVGWILEDFPNTLSQAKLFERLLSGVDVDAVAEDRWDRVSDLTTPPPKPEVDMSKAYEGMSGVHLFISIEAGRDEVLRRCLGRRVDPQTDDVYHLDSNRPPYDVICKVRNRSHPYLLHPLIHSYIPPTPQDHARHPLCTHSITSIRI